MTDKLIMMSNPTDRSPFWRRMFNAAEGTRTCRWSAREPRHCTHETFNEGPAPGCVDGLWLKVWTFHYSDGTTEQLKRIIEK